MLTLSVIFLQQVLVSHAVNISHEYPQDVAPAYLGAALTLRLPYWDWAFDPRVPEIMSNVTVTVNGPAGPTTTRNPLYSYRFQGSIQKTWDDVVYSGYNETIRCLGDDGQVNNITASNLKMDSQGPGLKLMVVGCRVPWHPSCFPTRQIDEAEDTPSPCLDIPC